MKNNCRFDKQVECHSEWIDKDGMWLIRKYVGLTDLVQSKKYQIQLYKILSDPVINKQKVTVNE